MKPTTLILIISLVLISGMGIVSATINITPSEVSYNYIKWTWPHTANLTGLAIDGKLQTTFDPNTDYFILSNLNEGEIHSINLYATGDFGTNQTTTTAVPPGDLPLGIWIYGIPALIALLVARYAKIAVINVITIMFALFGMYQLITVKTVMSGNLWTISLIFYFVLMFVGFIAWAFESGRWK
jgi:hypothetical protein